jgi:predicted dehydrogenase
MGNLAPITQQNMPVLTTANSNLRIGVIGCGYWGPKLVRNFRELPGIALTTVSDLREERMLELKLLYPELAITRDSDLMIDGNVDAVVIATPVHTHYALAKRALLAGKHVFIEKPITANSDQAYELQDLSTKLNLTLMVGHTFVYNPAVEAVKEIICSGELGEIYYLSATRVNLGLFQPDINVMWDLAPHDISMLRYILGADPLAVSAHGAVYVNKTHSLHEVVYMTLVYENGMLVNLHLSWLDPVKQRRLTIVGSKKMLVYDDIADDKVVIYNKGVEVPPYSVTEAEFHASYRHGDEVVYPLNWREPLRVECEHFIESIQTGCQPRSNGEDGLRVIKVLESAQRSLLNSGVQLKIEY